jgi:hypothetical protein
MVRDLTEQQRQADRQPGEPEAPEEEDSLEYQVLV